MKETPPLRSVDPRSGSAPDMPHLPHLPRLVPALQMGPSPPGARLLPSLVPLLPVPCFYGAGTVTVPQTGRPFQRSVPLQRAVSSAERPLFA